MKARLLLPALAFLAGPLAAQDNDPPGRAGRVSSVAGTVAFQAAGSPDWSTAPLNYTVTTGDHLLTHRGSRAEIEVGPFAVRLADSTDLAVVNLTDTFTQLGLNRGTLRVSVYRLGTRDSMEVDTPNGAMIIRSAGRYRVDVLDGVSTIVSVEDGVAELSGPSLDYTVKRGQSVELTGVTAISANMIQHPANSDFDQWSVDRDNRQQQSTCSRYMSRDIPGCADLDSHGRWEYQSTYGYVWRPTVVTVDWVPYRQGRWVWTGPWGWSWVEDSPWGFAPFHYGRWITVSGVWLWAPGPIIRRPCYAPALVVFVGSGPRYHQAWFPLGWREPYYPRYRHSDRYLREVNIANVRSISNVDEFVDPRRADRIAYTHRQATTVVSNEVFGRRQVEREATTTRLEESVRAPIVRDRGQATRLFPRTGEPTRVTDPVRLSAPRRVSDPVGAEPNEPRPRSSLIFRNSPPLGGRRSGSESVMGDPSVGGTLRPRRELQAADTPTPAERGRTIIRRNEPTQLSAAPEQYDRPRGVIERSSGSNRFPQQRTATPRESQPRESSPGSAPEPRARIGTASRLPSRRPPV
jgi:hypothetical protein